MSQVGVGMFVGGKGPRLIIVRLVKLPCPPQKEKLLVIVVFESGERTVWFDARSRVQAVYRPFCKECLYRGPPKSRFEAAKRNG